MQKETGLAHGTVGSGPIAGNLFYLFSPRTRGYTAQYDLAGLQREEDQDVAGGQAGAGSDLGREEIGGPKPFLVARKEFGPSRVALGFGSGPHAVALQTIADSLIGNTLTRIGQSADDAIITPVWVLSGQLNDQPFKFDRNVWIDGGWRNTIGWRLVGDAI